MLLTTRRSPAFRSVGRSVMFRSCSVPLASVNNKQSSAVAFRGRFLGDEFGWQVIVKVVDAQIGSISAIAQSNNIGCGSEGAKLRARLIGTAIPRCSYASRVAIRPRGVRCRNPSWIRYGS